MLKLHVVLRTISVYGLLEMRFFTQFVLIYNNFPALKICHQFWLSSRHFERRETWSEIISKLYSLHCIHVKKVKWPSQTSGPEADSSMICAISCIIQIDVLKQKYHLYWKRVMLIHTRIHKCHIIISTEPCWNTLIFHFEYDCDLLW